MGRVKEKRADHLFSSYPLFLGGGCLVNGLKSQNSLRRTGKEFYEFRVRDQFRVRDAGKKTLCLKTHFLVQIFLECGRTPLESIDFSENAPTLYKIFLDLQLTGLAGA